MNDLITPQDKIIEELKTMQNFLDSSMSEDAEEAILRGNELQGYIARSGKLLADAKYHKDQKINSGVVAEMRHLISLPATTANKYVDTLAKQENYLVTWSDRVNRAATHQLDWCRTLVSKAKVEIAASTYPGNR